MAEGYPEVVNGGDFYGNTNPTTRLATDKITINQNTFVASVYISAQELRYSIGDVEQLAIDRLMKKAAATIDSHIINRDNTLAAIGNINSVDALPATTFVNEGGVNNHRLIGTDSLRKIALSTAGLSNNVGIATFDQLINTRSLLGDYSADLEDMLLIFNMPTYNKYLTVQEFKQIAVNLNYPTSTVQTGMLTPKVAGVDFVVVRDLKNTDSTGNVSATPANNTKGAFMYVMKSAIQYGFGEEPQFFMERRPKGVLISMTFDFGFAVVNKKAGQMSPSVALGYNVTL